MWLVLKQSRSNPWHNIVQVYVNYKPTIRRLEISDIHFLTRKYWRIYSGGFVHRWPVERFFCWRFLEIDDRCLPSLASSNTCSPNGAFCPQSHPPGDFLEPRFRQFVHLFVREWLANIFFKKRFAFIIVGLNEMRLSSFIYLLRKLNYVRLSADWYNT